MGLATWKVSREGLNQLVMGTGKSHWTCPFSEYENGKSHELALLRASRDSLNQLVMASGKSHGTCHFRSVSTQAES